MAWIFAARSVSLCHQHLVVCTDSADAGCPEQINKPVVVNHVSQSADTGRISVT